ncbi:MAG: transglutaminase domain-containing protein, partial [Peptococcaceae bacterium]|nr:transglutaminase domain-containing protein [Peptococcaceae bacterium]
MAITKKPVLFKIMAICLALIISAVAAPAPAQALVATIAQKTGATIHGNDKVTIDASNLAEGYVIVKYIGGKDVRIKAQIAKKDGSTYSYDINNKGALEVLPLTEGDGNYSIGVFENVS